MYTRVATVLSRRLAAPASREDRNLRRMLAHAACMGLVTGGIQVFLPVYLVRLGASAIMVSLLTSLPALATVAMALPGGAIASRWRRPCATSALCFQLMRLFYLPVIAAAWLSPSLAPLLIVVVWGLSAVPALLGNAAFYDVIAAAVSPERRPAVNGARWALMGLVSAVFVALCGQLLSRVAYPLNYQLVFSLSFAGGVVGIVFYAQLETADREPPPQAARPSLRAQLADFLRPLTARPFAIFAVVTLILRIGIYLPSGLYSIFWVRQLGATEAWVGWRATVENGALMLGYYLGGRVATRKGFRPVLLAATLGLGAAPLLNAVATPRTLPILFLAALLSGASGAALDVSLFEWLVAVMPPAERPRYVAMNLALLNIVAFFVPIAGAAAAGVTGIPIILVAAGLCMWASAGLAYRWRG